MRLVSLSWNHVLKLGENPECAALGCHCILYVREKVYECQSDHGASRSKFFCRDCIEKKPFVVTLLTRNPREQPLNPSLSLGILAAKV